MKQGIKSRIVKQELINWKSLKWFQPKGLKSITPEDLARLKNSILKNHFLQPFIVWEDNAGDAWILDGHHRKTALIELENEGFTIPEKLPGNFISCKNEKEAAKFVLIYSSAYAHIEKKGFAEYLNEYNLDSADLSGELDISSFGVFEPVDISKDLKRETLKPFAKTDILLSFPPDTFIHIEPFLNKLREIEGVEIEQSSN